MEMRTAAPEGAYVDTTIPKVAETPLEGSDASSPKTFGPFLTDQATKMKTCNSKGYTVRFEGDLERRPDPIEKAFDSIFLFMDDVREASNTVRGEGEGEGGCMSAVEHVTEGMCRNPCANPCMESLGQMQPPADLMLNVPEEKREEPDAEQSSPEVSSPPAETLDFTAMAKQNSVKDMSVSEAKEEEQEAGPVPTYTPVETISDKMRTLVPEDALQTMMNAFVIKTGEVKPNAAELTVKNGADSDPVVEAFDRMILFFDDVQNALRNQKFDHLVHRMTTADKLDESDHDRSDNTTLSEDTMKTANSVRIKPASLQMAEEEYAEAVAFAASLMSRSATDDELSAVSRDDLHKAAVERILSERSEYEEGFTEYKTEGQILAELTKDAENAIMSARSNGQSQAEELIVLGHSGTLTPIPEADEASAGTPASDMIEHGVLKGTIPEVPLLPVILSEEDEDRQQASQPEQETAAILEKMMDLAKKAEDQEPPKQEKEAKNVTDLTPPAEAEVGTETKPVEESHLPVEDTKEALESEMKMEESDLIVRTIDNLFLFCDAPKNALYKLATEKYETDETDPIVRAIDRAFICYDGIIQERKNCEGCLGATVPSDIVEEGDEIQDKAGLEPRINSEGQSMLEEALRLVQDADGTEDALRTIRSEGTNEPPTVQSAASDLLLKLRAEFDETREQTEPLGKKRIVTAHGIQLNDNDKNRAIAELVEAAFEESDRLRQAMSAVTTPTPQMPLDMDKQTKVEFEIPELMKHNQDPYIAWGGDDSELMASINADRKLSEMEHENIFRDVSKGLQESSGGIITRADNQNVFSIYKAPAFTEGNSSSAEFPEDKLENPAKAALKVLCAESISVGESEGSDMKGQPDIVTAQSSDSAARRARELGSNFPGWSLSKKREEKLRTKAAHTPN